MNFDNDLNNVINKRRVLREQEELIPKIFNNAKLILDLNKSQLSILTNQLKSKNEEEQIIFLTHIIDKAVDDFIDEKLKYFFMNFRILLEKIARMS